MDDKARNEKNSTIRENGKATRLRHSSMRPVVVEMKLDLKCLNKSERDNLFLYFTQCRWLCNYLISLDADAFRSFDTRERNITSLDKDGNTVERLLTLPAKFIQSVMAILWKDFSHCLPNSSRVCILPSNRICHHLQQSGIREERRMENLNSDLPMIQ